MPDKRMAMKYTIEQLRSHYRRLYSVISFISRAAGGNGGIRDGVNPFYGQSGDLSIILGEYYGMPHSITSPLGSLKIDTPCVVDESWRPKVEEALGLKPAFGRYITRDGVQVWSHIYTDMGCMGPGWALLRDVDGMSLPETTTAITGWTFGPATPMTYEYEEAKAIWDDHISEIFRRQ